VPTLAALVNKAFDFAFAIYTIRVLGPTALGQYTWAVLVVGYLDILVNFGLGILITREVARDRSLAPRYLGRALLARSLLWLVAIGGAVVIAGPLAQPLSITPEMGIALIALTIGIGISNLAGVLSALFSAFELMGYPAGVSVVTTLTKIGFGGAALAAGLGIVGLSAASIATNLITAGVLLWLAWHRLGPLRAKLDRRSAASLVDDSYPLLLNNLLATLFFRIDGLMLRAWAGDTVLGWYSTAYKFVDGLGIVPSNLTLALFPILARQAAAESAGSEAGVLARTTARGLRLLLSLAFPLAVGVTLLAEPIVRTFAGERFLPHSAIALQILVWFAPLSFVNGLLQYVLIAAGRQRAITLGFVIATAFNLGANVLLIPRWSYAGAALVTVLSELALLGPFWWVAQRTLGRLQLISLAWRPALAAAAMAPGVVIVAPISWVAAIPVGALLYGAALYGIDGVPREDRMLIMRMLRRGV
jgi:O-antigen/teichoic acid export membrane protein